MALKNNRFAAQLGLVAVALFCVVQSDVASSQEVKKSVQKVAPKAAAKAPAGPPAAGPDQISLMQYVLTGQIPCELGKSIKVEKSTKYAGYADVSHAGRTYLMTPVRTSTGALRLEDSRNGVMMLQIANKTMLMNQRAGQRLVDGCEHPDQLALMERIRAEQAVRPTEALLK